MQCPPGGAGKLQIEQGPRRGTPHPVLACDCSQCIEKASRPGTTPEERKHLLSFVVVGGGPTGVEVGPL